MALPIEIARAEVGVKETTGKNDGEPSTRYMGGRTEAWCSHFVAWCYRTAGVPLRGDRVPRKGSGGENPLASVALLERHCEKEGIRRDASGYTPEQNDIIFFADRAGSDAGAGKGQRHVGLVDHVDGELVHTIEGNIANKVTRRVHRLDDPRITGYGSYAAHVYPSSAPMGGRPMVGE